MPAKAVIFDVGGVLMLMDWKAYDRFGVEHGLRSASGCASCIRPTPSTPGRRAGGHGQRSGLACLNPGGPARAYRRSRRGLPARLVDATAEPTRAQHRDGRHPSHRGLHGRGAAQRRARPARTHRREPGPEVGWHDLVVSAKVGLAKPDHAIYHLVMERLSLDPEQCSSSTTSRSTPRRRRRRAGRRTASRATTRRCRRTSAPTAPTVNASRPLAGSHRPPGQGAHPSFSPLAPDLTSCHVDTYSRDAG
jgi:hypothetical protein